MSEVRAILVDTATRLCEDLCSRALFDAAEQGGCSTPAWQRMEAAGLTRATVAEARGGDGIDLGDALALVREAGRHALPLPLAETLLAELALAAAGLAPLAGIATVGPVLLPPTRDGAHASPDIAEGLALQTRQGGGGTLTGTLRRIPWARHADHLVALARSEGSWATVVVSGPALRASVANHDANWANEPRDTVKFDALELPAHAVGASGNGWTPEDLCLQGALMRTCAMAGAMDRVLALAVQYAQERVQFGRAIGHFQAVQHQLAVLATQVAAANAAADAAADAASRGPARFEIAAAKARIGEAAHIACGLAHQVHGAMGFTQEHALHRSTRRLWAWRDEFGTEAYWAQWIGRVASQVGGQELWDFITSRDKESALRHPHAEKRL